MASIYLIHFSKNYKHAKHYIGATTRTVEHRMSEHKNGNGARLLEVLNGEGIDYSVVRTWTVEGNGTEVFHAENELKANHAPTLCPVCNPEGWARRKATLNSNGNGKAH